MGATQTRLKDENGNFASERQQSFVELLTEKYQVELDKSAGVNFELRTLQIDDYDKGYCQLLSQLTTVGEVTHEEFEGRFGELNESDAYFIAVVEDLSSGRIVASATLVLEWKFIHGCGARGRIEDVVVDKAIRGHSLGSLLNRALVDAAQNLFSVYKLSLECKDTLIPFYERFGFKIDTGNNFLVQRFCDYP